MGSKPKFQAQDFSQEKIENNDKLGEEVNFYPFFLKKGIRQI